MRKWQIKSCRFAALTRFGLRMQKFLKLMRRISSKSLKKCLLRTEDGGKPQVFLSRYGRLIRHCHCRKWWISNFLQTGCMASRGGRGGKADRWRERGRKWREQRKKADNAGEDGEEENGLKHSSLCCRTTVLHSAALFNMFCIEDAPYPSAFICREGAGFGFVFFSCHLGSNSQEFLHLHLARVWKKEGKKQQNSCLLSPEPTWLTSEGWRYSDAKRGAVIAKTLPVHSPSWLKGCE